MTKISTDLNIRTYEHADMEGVINVWKECGLIRSWNNPKLDIQRKANTQKDLFFVGEFSNKIIATAMFGYDGHKVSGRLATITKYLQHWLSFIGKDTKLKELERTDQSLCAVAS